MTGLRRLINVRSQTAVALDGYYGVVADAPDRPEKQAKYFGTRVPSDLFIAPNVQKTERRRAPAKHTIEGTSQQDRERERVPTPPRIQLGISARDAGESLLPDDEELVVHSVPWEQERADAARGRSWRAVVQGPPGQGKSMLAEMTARRIAVQASEQLRLHGVETRALALPAVISLDRLGRLYRIEPSTQAAPRDELIPEAALRRALQAELKLTGCPEQAARYVADHAHESRCWLFLDGLDETDLQNPTLHAFFKVLAGWSCNVVVTTRPYGYDQWRLPAEWQVSEYRLAPLTPEQSNTYVRTWYGGVSDERRLLGLLSITPSLRDLAQVPFLLSLLCAINQAGELPADVTRTGLYERIVELMLGADRASGWLPLLGDLGWWMVLNDARSPRIGQENLLDRIRDSDRRPAIRQVGATDDNRCDPAAQAAAQVLLGELRSNRVLCPAGGGVWVFPHRSMAAFFAARYLARALELDPWDTATVVREPLRSSDPRRRLLLGHVVDRKSWDPDWELVIQFLCGLMQDPTPLLTRLSRKKTDCVLQSRLCLAARCLPEMSAAGRRRAGAQADSIASAVFELAWTQICQSRVHAHVKQSLPAIATPSVMSRLAGLLGNPNAHMHHCVAAEVVRGIGVAAAAPILSTATTAAERTRAFSSLRSSARRARIDWVAAAPPIAANARIAPCHRASTPDASHPTISSRIAASATLRNARSR